MPYFKSIFVPIKGTTKTAARLKEQGAVFFNRNIYFYEILSKNGYAITSGKVIIRQ